MDNNSKIFVAGHNGLVGSAIIRNLEAKHYQNIYWVGRENCDLRDRSQVDAYFKQSQPEYVIIAATLGFLPVPIIVLKRTQGFEKALTRFCFQGLLSHRIFD